MISPRLRKIGGILRNLKMPVAYSSSSFALMLCKCKGANELKDTKSNELSHEHCIKQSCVLTVNSTTTLLTTTVQAILDTSKKYKDSLAIMSQLLKESIEVEGVGSNLDDCLVEVRVEVKSQKEELDKLNLYLASVEKLVTAATEAAFLVGADYMCTALCERLHSAQQEICKTFDEIKKLEVECLHLQTQAISRTGEKC